MLDLFQRTVHRQVSVQLMNEIGYLVRSPLHRLLENVVHTVGGIINPVVTVCGDIVSQKMNDPKT